MLKILACILVFLAPILCSRFSHILIRAYSRVFYFACRWHPLLEHFILGIVEIAGAIGSENFLVDSPILLLVRGFPFFRRVRPLHPGRLKLTWGNANVHAPAGFIHIDIPVQLFTTVSFVVALSLGYANAVLHEQWERGRPNPYKYWTKTVNFRVAADIHIESVLEL